MTVETSLGQAAPPNGNGAKPPSTETIISVEAINGNVRRVRHDLKQPLTSILGYSGMAEKLLNQDNPDIKKVLYAISVVVRNGRRMLAIIEDQLGDGQIFEQQPNHVEPK